MRASCIFVLAMSGTGAAAASVTNSVWEVDKIAEVDFGGILGTRAGAVAVGMTSDCKVWFTAQDALQFASGGASDGRARQKLAAMIQTDGVPEGFHRGRWTWYLVVMYRGNGGIRRGIYQLQGDDNGHVGRPR